MTNSSTVITPLVKDDVDEYLKREMKDCDEKTIMTALVVVNIFRGLETDSKREDVLCALKDFVCFECGCLNNPVGWRCQCWNDE